MYLKWGDCLNREELKLAFEEEAKTVTMEAIERKRAYFAGESVDHLPFDLNGADLSIVDNMGYTTSQMANDYEIKKKVMDVKFNVFDINDEIVGVPIANILGTKSVTQEHGTSYVIDHVLKDYSQIDELLKFDAKNNPTVIGIINHTQRLLDDYPKLNVRMFLSGPWSLASKIRKIEDLLRDIRKDQDNLRRLLDFAVDSQINFAKFFTKEIGKVEQMVMDPVTCTDLLSPKQFEDLSFPYLDRFFNELYNLTSMQAGLHICGHTKAIWNKIGELNINFFACDNMEDIEELKNTLGDKLAISGNVPPLEVMRFGNIDDVINGVKDCIKKAADNPKGYIVDLGCQLPLNVPKENLYAYVYAIRKYSKNARIGEIPEAVYQD